MGNDIAFNKYHCPFVIASKFRVFLPISSLRSQIKKRSRNPTQVVTRSPEKSKDRTAQDTYRKKAQ